MKKRLSFFAKSKFVKNMTVLMTGTAIGQVITLLSAPIVSRLFEPSMYGVFGVYNSIILLISMVSTLRYDHALMLPTDNEDAANLLAVSLLSVFFFTFVSIIGCIIFNDYILTLTDSDIVAWPIVIPIAVLFMGVYQSLASWCVRQKMFLRTASSHVSRAVTSTLAKLVAGFINPHSWGLIVGHLIGEAAANLNVICRVISGDRSLFRSSVRISKMKELARQNLDFAMYGSGQMLVGAAALQVPVLLMAQYYGASTVGYYSFAMQMIQFPLAIVQNSLRQVFYQKACETYNNNGDVYALLKKTTLSLYGLFLIPALVIFIFAPFLFSNIFGEQWLTAGVFAQYIIPASFIAFPKVPAVMLTRIYHKQRNILILETCVLVAEILLFTVLGSYVEITTILCVHAMIIGIYNLLLIGYMFKVSKQTRCQLVT
ncbi:MAG: lipopolysaccharide biosynthesis protein [Chlorobium sp.]|nr:lipopolysaccharide biosynthesis protein [Chlorobium sp.]